MKVVVTAFRVLEEVAIGQPVGVSEVSRRLELPKSTVQRALRTLAAEGWVQQESNGSRHWIQTPKLLALASRGRGTTLREVAMPVMHRLLDAANENVHLTVRQGNNVVVVEKLESSHPVRVFDPLGTAIPLHASSTGKAILAWAGAGIDEYIDQHLEVFTDRTIADPEALRQELQRIRQQGYSYNRGEWRSEIKSIAAPIREVHGSPRSAISVSAPDHRLPDEKVEVLADLVLLAAKEISESV